MNQIKEIISQTESNSKKVGPENFDAYSDIELTEDEVKIALLYARRNKYVAKQTEEYKKRMSKDNSRPALTATALYTKVHDAGFVVDEFNKQIIWNLCQYFTHDKKCPYDINKGLMLYGPVGCYKTSLMKFFKNNQTNSFIVIPVNDISAEFAKDGHDAIIRHKGFVKSSDVIQTYNQTDIGICFDDFGTEVDKKHYGNESNVMADIILGRFSNNDLLRGKTHITTNLTVEDIQIRYGARVRSRLREMVNQVIFPDNTPDRRK